MKKLCYSWCVLFFFSSVVFGQATGTLLPKGSPVGIYLNVGVFPMKGETGLVERDNGRGFEVIGSLSAPATKSMLYQRMLNYSLRFPDYYAVTEQLVDNLWQMLQSGKQDSIQKAGIPVMLLAMGGAFLDTTANLQAGIRYRVQMGARKWESSILTVKTEPARTGQIVFQELKPSEQAIRAEWRIKTNQQPAILSVLRKRIGIDSSFSRLNTDLGFEKTKQGDSLRIHLSDTTVLAGINYLYFLSGKDFIGNVIARSDTIRSIAGNRATVNGITRLTTKAAADSSGIQLFWNKQDVNSIRSIRVFRSPYYDSAYVQLAVLPAGDTSWVDRSAAIGANYYYQLAAQGNGDFSFPSPRVFGSFINNKRLLPPSALKASKTDSGTKLSWRYHTYMNLMGFRIYRALGNNGRFKAITDVITAPRDSLHFTFTDSDPALTNGQLYSYAVAAIGRSFKESPLSEIIQLNIRQKGPLTAPYQVRSLELSDSTILITWQDMRPVDPNIGGYQVYRKALGVDSTRGFERVTLKPITGVNEFTDRPAKGRSWQYVVQSVNTTDSSVYSLPVIVKLSGDKPLPPGRVRLFRQKNSVIINWDGTLIPGINQYHIYRASAASQPVQIASVEANGASNSYEDKKIESGSLFFYYVTTETSDHIESNRSEEVSIRLPR